MATSPALRTATTLIPNQELLVKQGLTEALCFNDSALTDRHYRTIPRDNSNEGIIRWGNVKSFFREFDGDYSVAISMFEYVPDKGFGNQVFNTITNGQNSGQIVNVKDRGNMLIQKDAPIEIDGDGRVLFRKIVWVKASDLFLGSTSQFDSIRLKEEQDQKDLLDNLLKDPGNGDPKTGNGDGLKKALSTTTKVILGVVAFFIAGIWILVAFLKKKKRKKEEEAKMMATESNNLILEKSTS